MFGSSCVSPIDNYTVFLISGRMSIPNTNQSDYTWEAFQFDSKKSYWTMPVAPGYNVSFVTRNEMQAVIDNTGKIFIYGGINLTSIWFADMTIFDIATMTWSTFQFTNIYLADYAAVILPNSLIIYIVQDGNILIIGGSNDAYGYATVSPALAVLNTNTWMWTIPNFSLTNGPPSLTYHSAALYEDYIIIAFRRITTTSNKTLINNIYILDMKNYAWVTTMNLNKPTASISGSPTVSISGNPTSQAQETSSHLLIGIGFGLGGLILVGLLSFIGFIM
ncbi:galactose oxidase [Gigaspora margarita]|uniref:Galactose oxidase n=1 Tax=Gigaspora margarita TaxID=4874 RepID=A0A8H4AC63_GIGMA|nr:galactose oxidase [Gigaspora margarita]